MKNDTKNYTEQATQDTCIFRSKDAPLAQKGHLNRLANVALFLVCTGAFFARFPILIWLIAMSLRLLAFLLLYFLCALLCGEISAVHAPEKSNPRAFAHEIIMMGELRNWNLKQLVLGLPAVGWLSERYSSVSV